jgi:hypothetical protein
MTINNMRMNIRASSSENDTRSFGPRYVTLSLSLALPLPFLYLSLSLSLSSKRTHTSVWPKQEFSVSDETEYLAGKNYRIFSFGRIVGLFTYFYFLSAESQ